MDTPGADSASPLVLSHELGFRQRMSCERCLQIGAAVTRDLEPGQPAVHRFGQLPVERGLEGDLGHGGIVRRILRP